MKTASVTVTSSKSISVPKAAKVISLFVSSENGASQAVSAFLKRASESFEELSTFYREVRNSGSTHKHNEPRWEAIKNPRKEERDSEDRGYGRDHGCGGERDARRVKHKNRNRMADNIGIDMLQAEVKADGGRLEAEGENSWKKKVRGGEEAHQRLNMENLVLEKERGRKATKKRKTGVVEQGADTISLAKEEEKGKKDRKKRKINGGIQEG